MKDSTETQPPSPAVKPGPTLEEATQPVLPAVEAAPEMPALPQFLRAADGSEPHLCSQPPANPLPSTLFPGVTPREPLRTPELQEQREKTTTQASGRWGN